MDFLTLFLCAKLLHLPLRAWKTALAASIGGIYGVAALFFHAGTIWNLLWNLSVAALMSWIAFSPKKLTHFCKSLFLFYGIGFLLGGSMTALYHLCNHYLEENRIFLFGNYETLQSSPSLVLILTLAALSALLAMLVGRLFTQSATQQTARLWIKIEETTLECDARVDSGNLLCDPISGAPVLFLQYDAVKSTLPYAFATFFAQPDTLRLASMPPDFAKRIRMLPMATVSGRKMIYCLRADTVKVDGVARKALLAIVSDASGDFGGYPALIPLFS